jgi:filamentous hemagglutinin family protein|tara:strand:- start:9101 stop:9679 length:579 start_codon:yes stop_codon:yes gene_type:complete
MRRYFRLSLALFVCARLSSADVVLDGTTGGTADTSVGAGNGFTYDIQSSLGEVKSSNLFHSFSEFDIAVTEHANFSGDASIDNIIARITGGESSSIAGRITSSIDSASLWLINPSGFLFANGAVVDIDGAFNLSTADFVEFADDARFYANLSNNSVLTSAAISSFGFISSPGGAVTFESDRASSIGEDRSDG